MSLRLEFVQLASLPGANVSALCRRFAISRTCGYKWLSRGLDSTDDQPRRPLNSPHRTPDSVEQALLATRDAHPDWGARKLKRFLQNAGHSNLPAVSTITSVLRRHGRISEAASEAAKHWQRFEHEHPNSLWQMDFKGHFAMANGRCHPLTVLDDHSRFNVVLEACPGESLSDVQPALEAVFRRYGMPKRISCDNGNPWGTSCHEDRLTRLGVWLIRLDVRLTHARPFHPQTNGKDERFHRTLKHGLLTRRVLLDLPDAQRAFDRFRHEYNHERPHDSLDLDVPASRFKPSERDYPKTLPAIHYDADLPVRKVDASGKISFQGRSFRVSRALQGEPVALIFGPETDGKLDVMYCRQKIRSIDMRQPDQAS